MSGRLGVCLLERMGRKALPTLAPLVVYYNMFMDIALVLSNKNGPKMCNLSVSTHFSC